MLDECIIKGRGLDTHLVKRVLVKNESMKHLGFLSSLFLPNRLFDGHNNHVNMTNLIA